MAKRVKREDVAKMAGVSVATVSYVLNGSRRVSPEIEKNVWEAASSLGYANQSEQTRERGEIVPQPNTIYYLTEDLFNVYQLEAIDGFRRAALEKDYFVHIFDTRDDSKKYMEHILRYPPEGVYVLTAPNSFTDDDLAKLRDVGVCILADFARNTYIPGVSYIMSDMFNGFEQAVRYLYENGHTQIGYVSAFDETCYYDFRLTAFKTAMRKVIGNHLPAVEYGSILCYQTTEESGREIMRDMLKNHPEVTAVICTNDLMAMGAIKEIRKHGLRVPEDISVIGVDDIQASATFNPPLTTIAQDGKSYGNFAFGALYEDIKTGKTGKYIVPMNLVVRQSTGPVRK